MRRAETGTDGSEVASRSPKMTSVVVSEASRRDAHGGIDQHTLVRERDELVLKAKELGLRKSTIESRLGALGRAARSGRLPDSEYQSICAEHELLKQQLRPVVEELNQLKLQRMSLDRDIDQSPDRKMTNQLLERILIELRAIKGLLAMKS